MHHHGHGHDHHVSRGAQKQALKWSLGANSVLLIAEIAGGIAFASLALLADAAHLASDVTALVIALLAHFLMERPHSSRHTYGYKRAEVVGALANAVLLIALSVWIVVTALGRFDSPVEIEGGGLLALATLGFVINLGSALVLRSRSGGSLNMRAAYLHMVADALGSVGAMAAGIAALAWDAYWVDAAASIAIALLIVASSVSLVRETLHVLLEGAPAGIDTDEVSLALSDYDVVEEVHHVHVWSIASDMPALSAHVVLRPDMSLHEAQEHGGRLKELLAERFGIEHATLELECHSCEPEEFTV